MNRVPLTHKHLTRRQAMRRVGIVTLGAGLLPALQACGGDDDEPEDVTRVPVTFEPPPATPTEEGAATPPAGAPATEVTVVAGKPQEFLFEPSEFTIPANTDVTVTVTDEGAIQHTFTIDALNVNVEVQPGETKTTTINADPGDYEFYCAVPGHKEAGMVGTLHVE
ncbi:MAG: cupredoxin domain-containing protein [Thermomicrobiales bacterium]